MDGPGAGDRGPVVKYYRHADGRVATRSIGGPDVQLASLVPPAGDWVEIPADLGEELVTEAAQAREAERERRRATAADARADDYHALLDMGVPEATARRLTGHSL